MIPDRHKKACKFFAGFFDREPMFPKLLAYYSEQQVSNPLLMVPSWKL
jgi:hypothetical protein